MFDFVQKSLSFAMCFGRKVTSPTNTVALHAADISLGHTTDLSA